MDKLKELKERFAGVITDEPMSAHTSFRIGGRADAFVSAGGEAETAELMAFCRERDIPFMIMGNGTNMLVGDGGIRGLVIQIGRGMSGCRAEGTRIYAGAGALMSAAASEALRAGLTGFETLGGIPGTLGGGIYMNAGAYGGEIKNVIETVRFMDSGGAVRELGADELDFSYRRSFFSGGGYVILSCVLKLEEGDPAEIAASMKEYNRRRSEKQPLSMPSAGSVFKRPEGYFAGKLIEDCGLKGFCIGGAQISEKHAGFIVNRGGASAEDVLALIKHAQTAVKEKFGVELETEVRLIGER